MDPKNRQELHELLSALLDGALEPERQQHLGELLRQYSEARDLYLAYFSLHADLTLRGDQHGLAQAVPSAPRVETTRSEVEPEGSSLARSVRLPPSRITRRTRSVLWGAFGLSGLAAALLLALTLPRQRSRDVATSSDRAPEAIDHTVAVLLQAPEAVWEKTDLPTRAGASLPPGWLHLKSGFAHIEFYSGATVILEGPAEFRLISRTEAYCARGKLRATVPPQARGFTIGSPKQDLVDRGTEFCLQVGADDQTKIHVFQGKVELYDPGADRAAPPRNRLTTGQSVRLDGPGSARAIEMNPAAFQTAKDLATRAQAETHRRQRDWLAASEALRQDSSLVVYYPFQAEQPWSRTLADQAEGRRQPHDGVIVGCSWVTGRWPGKQGLEFKRVSDRVRFHVPGTFDSITLAAWVRVDALPNLNNSLMLSDGWEVGGLHWQIGETGTIILGIKAPAKTPNAHYHAPTILTPARLGQWLHLAVVYDRTGGQVTHYLDGRPVAQGPVRFDVPLRIGNAEIGNWNLASRRASQPIRYFSGCMDEFMLFSRAFSAPEIARLYDQGRPPL